MQRCGASLAAASGARMRLAAAVSARQTTFSPSTSSTCQLREHVGRKAVKAAPRPERRRQLPERPFREVMDTPLAFTEAKSSTGRLHRRAVNLAASLPVEVLEKAERELVSTGMAGCSVLEMGRRSHSYQAILDSAEESLRALVGIPDTHVVRFFEGGAELQHAAVPLNLLGQQGAPADYVVTGRRSERAVRQAMKYGTINQVSGDPAGLYRSVAPAGQWPFAGNARYVHYTAVEDGQGLEVHRFPYELLPEHTVLCCDATSALGTKHFDVSRYGVLYASAEPNFSTNGLCYAIIRRDLLPEAPLPVAPDSCDWNNFETAPSLFSVWLGKLTCDWMLERGGLAHFAEQSQKRSTALYDLIDGSNGFYRTFVDDESLRSRVQIVFSIGDGRSERSRELVSHFLKETAAELGWLSVGAQPLGGDFHDGVQINLCNHQPQEAIQTIRLFMRNFMRRHMNQALCAKAQWHDTAQEERSFNALWRPCPTGRPLASQMGN
eukprot:TRINITY_DN8299_c0_g1_i1.p1 TRINITY_DN8299_c0_g1~~TRINITY_DN8299_c0_g1_i1.p1  ORF type:complete len:514 (-),score=74.82 TRINITY_DN8299_c0_g1_i1:147-1628(-)